MIDQRTCPCVKNHTPEPKKLNEHHIWPLGWGGPDLKWNIKAICPNAHASIHELLRAYKAWNGMPLWELRKHFTHFERELAHTGWNWYKNQGRS